MRKVAIFAGLFVLMIGAALASMVRLTGPRPATIVEPQVEAGVEAPDDDFVIPVARISPRAIADTWGQSRDGGARPHQGTDIMAPGGTPVVAATSGVVEKLFVSGAGGITLYERSPDRRWTFYYAHLRGYADGIAEGTRVRVGQTIGYVGDTGNAGAGNYHLHFGMARMRPEERWWQGQPVNPYPYLARAGSAR